MRPVDRDGRVPVVPESPGDLGGAAHPDPGSGGDFSRTGRVARAAKHPERRPGDTYVRTVQRPVDAERLTEPGRAAGQVARRNPGPALGDGAFGDGAAGAPG